MPAVTFLSDSEARSYETVEGDKDCNELLQELNHASGRRWLIERRTFYRSRGLFRHAEEIKTYTLYLDCHGEYQVMNLVTPNGGTRTVQGEVMSCPMMTDIAHCPLYIESHCARGLGCVDDMALPCKVSRGKLNFQQAILNLAARGIEYPGMLQSIQTVGGLQ